MLGVDCMKKPVIGILSNLKMINENIPYDNSYRIASIYVDKIKEAGGTSIGLLSSNGDLDLSILDFCDAFVMQGGNKITLTHYQLIKYCIMNNKPLLGICLGMQAMIMYDCLLKELNKDYEHVTLDEIYAKYGELKDQNIIFINKLENADYHGGKLSSGELNPTIENIKSSIHPINIDKSSILYDIYGKDRINVISMHGYGMYNTDNLFNVIATSDDSVIEGIQYKKDDHFILGVQYHTEQEDDNPVLKKLIYEARKRIS
jgi:putative glutamine amidotransferase